MLKGGATPGFVGVPNDEGCVVVPAPNVEAGELPKLGAVAPPNEAVVAAAVVDTAPNEGVVVLAPNVGAAPVGPVPNIGAVVLPNPGVEDAPNVGGAPVP